MVGLFRRFVEIGRVVYINYGEYAGKVAVIIDLIDQNRIFVDGPSFGVKRHVINLKWVQLTDIIVKLSGRGARQKILEKAIKDQDIHGKWEKTTWAKNIAIRGHRQSLSDFDRFKLVKAKKARAGALKHELSVVRKLKVGKANEAKKKRADRKKQNDEKKKGQEGAKKVEDKKEGEKRKRIIKRKPSTKLYPRIAIGKGSPKGAITSADRKTRKLLLSKGIKRVPSRLVDYLKHKHHKKTHTKEEGKAAKPQKNQKAIQKA